jgi:hypothetical protein
MPDWKSLVRERLAPLRLAATAESDLTEELAQHLEDQCGELRSGGASEEEAYRKAISELDDMYPLRAELKRSQRMAKYDPVPAGDVRPGNFMEGLERSSLCRPHHAEKPDVRSGRGSDAGPGGVCVPQCRQSQTNSLHFFGHPILNSPYECWVARDF